MNRTKIIKRNTEKNEVAMMLGGLLVLVIKIALGTAAVVGVFYAAGYLVELLSGVVTLSAGMFVILTVAGLIIYLDSRPSGNGTDKRVSRTSC
jgi:hypothetical protein